MSDEDNGFELEAGSVESGIAEPVKKRRGRPRKKVAGLDTGTQGDNGSAEAGMEGVVGFVGGDSGTGADNGDSGADAGNHGSVGSRGKRGRPRGTGKTRTTVQARLEALTPVIFTGHHMLAGLLSAPELALSENEAKTLATAITECADAWGYNPVTDPRISTTFMLLASVAMIYGPRVPAIKQRLKKGKENNVVPIHA